MEFGKRGCSEGRRLWRRVWRVTGEFLNDGNFERKSLQAEEIAREKHRGNSEGGSEWGETGRLRKQDCSGE